VGLAIERQANVWPPLLIPLSVWQHSLVILQSQHLAGADPRSQLSTGVRFRLPRRTVLCLRVTRRASDCWTLVKVGQLLETVVEGEPAGPVLADYRQREGGRAWGDGAARYKALKSAVTGSAWAWPVAACLNKTTVLLLFSNPAFLIQLWILVPFIPPPVCFLVAARFDFSLSVHVGYIYIYIPTQMFLPTLFKSSFSVSWC